MLVPAAIILLAVWILVAWVVEGLAWRAVRLGKRPASPSFSAPPRKRPDEPTASLAFLGDMQRGVSDVALPLAGALAKRPADLLVSSGDFAAHAEAPYLGCALDAFEAAGIDTPTRVVPGNHDLWPRGGRDAEAGYALFRERFGPPSWSLRVGPALVVGLDNAVRPVSAEDVAWLGEELAAHGSGPWIAVCHRPPRHVLDADPVVVPGHGPLVRLLEEHPPLAVVAGNEHEYVDREVNGVAYVVNAHGGDVHGLALRRGPFELVRVEVGEDGSATRSVDKVARRRWLRVYLNQLAVRCWWSRRTWEGRLLSAPAGIVLGGLGLRAPVR